MIKRRLNKWQLVWDISHRTEYRNYGWRSMWFGIIKITSYPEQGVMIKSENYDGRLYRFLFWLPFQGDY